MAVKHAILTKEGVVQKTLIPMSAIRAKCMECSNFQWSEIKDCNIPDCALWVYRLGKKPDQQGNRNQAE